MLMSTDDRRVEHHVFTVGINGQGFEYTLKNTAFTPAPEASVRCLPMTEALRQIAPWNATLQQTNPYGVSMPR
jgi:hypothetical protein